MKDIFLDGGPVYLRLPTEKDAKGRWYQWLNDPIITRYQGKGIFPNTKETQRKYYLFIMNSKSDIVFAIIEKRTGKHIGCAGLHHIDNVHRSAELGIIIGEKEFWGKGYGKIVWNMITHYGLNVLNLHRVYATIMKGNAASMKSALASGFRLEGEARESHYKNGRYISTLQVGVLKKEFKRISWEI